MSRDYQDAKLFFVDFDDTFFIHEHRDLTYYQRVIETRILYMMVTQVLT